MQNGNVFNPDLKFLKDEDEQLYVLTIHFVFHFCYTVIPEAAWEFFDMYVLYNKMTHSMFFYNSLTFQKKYIQNLNFISFFLYNIDS